MSEVERIGIFGGTFDPIHNTHCDIARAALKEAALDRVIFVVSGRPPHKGEEGPLASPEARFAMVQAAIADEEGMEVSRIELDREGPSYTVDTLREFHWLFPEAEFFLIFGMDSLLDLPNWKDPRGILSLAKLLVVARPNMKSDVVPELEGHYELLPFQETDLSSTEARERIMSGAEPFDDIVPSAVAKLILEKGIYDASVADRSR